MGKCVRCVTWHVTLTSRAHEPQGILGLELSKVIHVLGVVEKCFVIIKRYLDGFVRVTSLEPTVHLCPQEGSPMDSQSKPRRNVVNCREFRNTKDGQLSE